MATIDIIINNNQVVLCSKVSPDKKLSHLAYSYFLNYAILDKVEQIYHKQTRFAEDTSDVVAALDGIATTLAQEGLFSKGADIRCLEAPKEKVLEQIKEFVGKNPRDRKSRLGLLIKNAKEGMKEDASAAFDMVDYFVANSATEEAAQFLTEVGGELYKAENFKRGTSYTTMDRAVSFYRSALEEGLVDKRFNEIFLRFAGECSNPEVSPLAGSEAAFYSDHSQKSQLESLLFSIKDGGYQDFAAFMKNIRRNLGGFKRAYGGLSPKMQEAVDVNKLAMPYIPAQIQKTIFGRICLQAANVYIRG